METKKWVFFGVPVAVIALVLGAAEVQRYRLDRPAKGKVEEGFGEAVAVFYPGTRWSNSGKFDPAPLWCGVVECRIPATIIDAQGRTASIQVQGSNSSQPVAISPDGKHVAIMDYAHMFHYDNGAFTTYNDGKDARNSGRTLVDDQGKVRVVDSVGFAGAAPGSARVRTYGSPTHEQVTEDADGTLYSCDGNDMIIEHPDDTPHDIGLKEFHINPDSGAIEPVGQLPELTNQDVVGAMCNGDGKGTMTFLLDGPPIEGKDTKHIRLYEKPWDEPFKPLAEQAMVHFNFTNHEYHYGMVRDDEAVWLLSDTGQVRRIDLKTGEATTAWEMKDQFNTEAPGRTHAMMFDKYVLSIGLKPGSSTDYIARAYDRKTGDPKLAKELPLLKKAYGGKDIMSITVRDPDALYTWLEQQPDLME